MALLLTKSFVAPSKTYLIAKSSLNVQNELATADFATLRELKARLKAVGAIKKITKSMKMVASSKLRKAQERLGPARNFAQLSQDFADSFVPKDSKSTTWVVISSDRGLCGALNSSLARTARKSIAGQKDKEHFVVCLGDKGFNQLRKPLRNEMVLYAGETSKKALNFAEASVLAENVLESAETDQITLLYNQFNSVISNTVVSKQMASYNKLIKKEVEQKGSTKIEDYQFLEDDKSHLKDLSEFNLGSLIFGAFADNQASELGARMSSMDNASRSAGDIIKKLEIQYNRGRQAAITKELSEIISGAESVKKKAD